ncbi:MAG: DUF3426 domain-containing protein [Humidesulfovibrio sp.]|nr:DUF3426 domain-containing protein [Humidesulfovibrio sp.]
MIVACPECQSKYNLPEEKIAPTGSKVRCARCKHVFTVMPPGKDFDKELADLTASEPASRPAQEAAPKKRPWDEEPAAAPKKMPWDDDEPAAGPTGDDDLTGGSSAGKGLFDDDETPTPSSMPAGHFDDDGGSFSASLDAESAKSGKGHDDEFLNSLGGGASLDAPRGGATSAKKKWIVPGVVLAVLVLAGAGLFVFKPWTKMNVPFLNSLSGKKEPVDNADKVKDIALRNVRQYYIPNEKSGNIFVVEGKAVNNFTTPKERIKVEISLFDEKGHVLVSKQLLCGNTLSQFQLQVQSEEEINASLNSEVGILTSNTYLKTGMDTPFMAVFFKPPDSVKEFGVKVIDAQDPK